MELPKKGVNSNIARASNDNNALVEKNLPLDDDADNSIIVEVEEKRAETIILSEGKTLRILALEMFGDKAFWVYIYQENRAIISNPNNVRSGLKLKIPDIDTYFIDNNNPESISKAKSESIRMLEGKKEI